MNPEAKDHQLGENTKTGWEELENLEQESFSGDDSVEDFQIPEETNREEQLADARSAVEAAYSIAPVVEQPAPMVENREVEPDTGIRIKRRPKFDIIGRKLDERRMLKIEEAMEEATSADIDERVEEASKNLDEHTAGLLLDYLEFGIPGALGTKVWSRLAEKVNNDDLRDAIEEVHMSPTFFVQRNGADLTGKVLSTFVDASVAQLRGWSEETSSMTPEMLDKGPARLDDILKLPPEEKSKYIDVMLEKNRPGNALQLLDEGLIEEYRDRFVESIKENEISPVQAVSGYFNGMTAEELGMPDTFKTTVDNLSAMDVPSEAIGYAIGSIPSAEVLETLGVELSTHIIQTEISDVGHVISSGSEYVSLTFNSKEEAEQLKKVYEFLGDRKDELNLAQMDFFRSHVNIVDELMAKGEITDEQLKAIAIIRNLQAVTDIDINSVDELDNFEEVLGKKIDEMISKVEQMPASDERDMAFEAIKDSLSVMLYGVSRNSLKVLARRTRLITDDRKKYDQVFQDVSTEELKDDDEGFKLFKKDKELTFSLDKFDEMVRDGKLSPEDEGEVLAMLAYLNAGNNPKKLREVLELARKNPDGAGAFYESLEKLDKIMLLESNQNFAKDMTTPEQLIADGAEVSTIDFEDKDGTTKQVQVINLDGRPFKILTHCLGAFGGFDLGQPDFWDKGTGAKYISSSLIANNCIRTAGERNMGVFYGFSNLGAESIVGMSSGDLFTYDIDYVGDETPDDEEDDSRTKVSAGRQSFWYSTPDELIDETRSRGRVTKFSEKNDWYHSYNEVVLNRYNGGPNGDKNDRLHPSCILCFGKDESAISEDMKRHAAYFGVPIYLIDEDKYGDK